MCGYNDDTEIGAVFDNCGPDTVRLLTTDFIGGESTQCVAPFSILRLGPSWFVANSVVIGPLLTMTLGTRDDSATRAAAWEYCDDVCHSRGCVEVPFTCGTAWVYTCDGNCFRAAPGPTGAVRATPPRPPGLRS
ncbi:hypothetical protein [Nocardia arizonensis]|uniref:hypothetical protein n=1 Tax=Nocardia arizonensis TaxID=1141647 RepID=UPI0006D2AC13|nr:hypothetical protein [Nocardia arizonensis]